MRPTDIVNAHLDSAHANAGLIHGSCSSQAASQYHCKARFVALMQGWPWKSAQEAYVAE